MTEDRGKGEDRKSVGRKTLRERLILIDDLFYARELPRRRGFMQLQRNSARQQQVANLFSAGIHGQQHGGLALFVFCARE